MRLPGDRIAPTARSSHRQELSLAPGPGVKRMLKGQQQGYHDGGQGRHARPLVVIWSSLPCSYNFSRFCTKSSPEDDGDKCRVISGEWVGPWTREVFTDASDVDIDHHVPLGHTRLSGGWDWPPERQRAYANDLANPVSLQATSSSVNRSKGKKPPDEWRPDEIASWCRYAADWITVKERWDLAVISAEVDALEEMLSTCDNAGSWGLSGPSDR